MIVDDEESDEDEPVPRSVSPIMAAGDEDKEPDDGSNVAVVTYRVPDTLFPAYCGLVLLLQRIPNHVVVWAEYCSCHGYGSSACKPSHKILWKSVEDNLRRVHHCNLPHWGRGAHQRARGRKTDSLGRRRGRCRAGAGERPGVGRPAERRSRGGRAAWRR